MVRILPPITLGDLGKVPISGPTQTYDSFISNNFGNTNYTIKNGYIEFVGSDGKISFVKRVDSNLPFLSSLLSKGIISGLEIQRNGGNNIRITAGVARFNSGIVNLTQQDIVIPTDTATIYYIFVDSANAPEISQVCDPDPTQIVLGAIYTNTIEIKDIYYHKRDILINWIDRYLDLMYALGYFYSGFALTYNASTSSLYCTSGVIHNSPDGDINWPNNPKITLQKVYYGNTFGEQSDIVDVNFLKVISIPSGGPAPVVQNSSVFHFIYIARSTGKYYLLVADRSIQRPILEVTVADLITIVNSVKNGDFLQRHCVLLGAIGVYFDETANTGIRLLQLHRGLSGARGVGTGLYPSPVGAPNGSILTAGNNAFYLNILLDGYILQFAAENKKGKFVVAFNPNEPRKIEFREYGGSRDRLRVWLYASAPSISSNSSKIVVAYSSSSTPSSSSSAQVVTNYSSANSSSFFGVGAFDTGGQIEYNNVDISSVVSFDQYYNYGVRTYTSTFPEAGNIIDGSTIRSFPGSFILGYSYQIRQTAFPNRVGFYITQVLNNEKPKKYKNIFGNVYAYKSAPNKLITNDALMVRLRGMLGSVFSSTAFRGESWSCVAKQSLLYNVSTGGNDVYSSFCGYTAGFKPSDANAPILGIQPNDVAFLDSPVMDDDTFEHYLSKVFLGGVYKVNDTTTPKDQLPHYNTPYVIREIFVPYANIPYTGNPT